MYYSIGGLAMELSDVVTLIAGICGGVGVLLIVLAVSWLSREGAATRRGWLDIATRNLILRNVPRLSHESKMEILERLQGGQAQGRMVPAI
jgi:hypothetical protein